MQGVFHCPHAPRKTAGQRKAGSKKINMAPVRPGEEELGRKWDRCLVDTTFKTGILILSIRKDTIDETSLNVSYVIYY